MALDIAPQKLSNEQQSLVDQWNKERQSADAEILKLSEKVYAPLYQKRAEIAAKIPNFWAQAVRNCEHLEPYIDDVDQPLLEKLKEVKVTRDLADPRAAKVEFIFEDNDYLEDNHLIKEFSIKKDSQPLGSTEFEWESDLEPKPSTIKWKSDDVNLCKKKPTTAPNGLEDDSFEPGSFFSSFFESTHPAVAGGIGEVLVAAFYPSAMEWYTGEAIGAFDDDDSEEYDSEEDEEELDDDEAEIDLEDEDEEKPKSKKPKTE